MKVLRQKQPRLRLSLAEYEAVRRRVLERDCWRCQSCGSQSDLQVHHVKPRSQLGHDALGIQSRYVLAVTGVSTRDVASELREFGWRAR